MKMIIRIGNVLFRAVSLVLALSFISYGSLTFWDMTRTEIKAFAKYDLLKFRPDIEDKEPPYLDELLKINSDTAGWINLYNTHVDYPVMQGKTDMEYLNKDVYGEYSITGSVFLSVLNEHDFSGPYQLLYGHHMENGTMFGDLDRFLDEDFFFNLNEMRYRSEEGVLILPDRAYDLSVFAVIRTDAYDPMIYRADKTEDEMDELMEYIRESAVFIRDVGEISHLLALSTCDGGPGDGRIVVLVKVSDNERPYPTRESEKRVIKRKAVGHPLSGKNWALIDLVIVLVMVILLFPLHHLREMRAMGGIGLRVISLLTGSLSIGVFIAYEDMMRPMKMTGEYTLLMIASLIIVWIIQRMRYNKGGVKTNEKIQSEDQDPGYDHMYDIMRESFYRKWLCRGRNSPECGNGERGSCDRNNGY